MPNVEHAQEVKGEGREERRRARGLASSVTKPGRERVAARGSVSNPL